MGYYGMSVSDITDVTGDYAEILRLSGNLTGINNQRTSEGIKGFIADISSFAEFTGKDRRKIEQETKDLLSDSTITSQHFNEAQTKAAATALAFATSLSPNFGKLLQETIASGNIIYSEAGRSLLRAGGADLASNINRFADNVKMGAISSNDIGDIFDNMKSIANDQTRVDILRRRATAGNDADAKALLDLLQTTEGRTREEWVKIQQNQQYLQKHQHALTQFLETFESLWDSVSGSFVDGVLDSLKAFDMAGNSIEDWSKKLAPSANELGEVFGKLISDFLGWFQSFAKVGGAGGPDELVQKIEDGFNAVGSVFSFVEKAAKIIGTGLSGLANFFENHPKLGEAIGIGLATIWTTNKVTSFIDKVFGLGSVRIKANVVYVDSALGGGIGDSLKNVFKGKSGPGVAGAAEGIVEEEQILQKSGILSRFFRPLTSIFGRVAKLGGSLFGLIGRLGGLVLPAISNIGGSLTGGVTAIGTTALEATSGVVSGVVAAITSPAWITAALAAAGLAGVGYLIHKSYEQVKQDMIDKANGFPSQPFNDLGLGVEANEAIASNPANTITPATPVPQSLSTNNPYKDLTGEQLKAEYDSVITSAALRNEILSRPEIYGKEGQEVLKRTENLQREQVELTKALLAATMQTGKKQVDLTTSQLRVARDLVNQDR